MRWNGSAWATVTVPDIGTLTSVAATGRSDVWAVSKFGIIHWDGTSWSKEPVLDGAIRVAARTTDDAWAVGNDIKHWDGNGWTVTSIPVPNATLQSVAAIAADNVWVVGYTGVAPNRHVLIMHWDGSAWSSSPVPTPISAIDVTLNSVDFYNWASVWAVGSYVGPDGSRHTLTEYWDGSDWRVIVSPDAGANYNELYEVRVTKEHSVWAVGEYINYFGNSKTLVLHWTGDTWAKVNSVDPGTNSRLRAVAGSIGGDTHPIIARVWAVGNYAPSGASQWTLIEHLTAPSAPRGTWSYYEFDVNPNTHRTQGEIAGQQGRSGIIFLSYNRPKNYGTQVSPIYGARLIGSSDKTTIEEIETAVKSFMDGYHAYWQGWPQTIKLAVSITNHDLVPTDPAELTEGHAHAWADMVTRLLTYSIIRGYDEIFPAAGIDAEPSWEPGYLKTEEWIESYITYPNRYSALYTFGSIDNYPCLPNMPNPEEPPNFCSAWDVNRLYMANFGISPGLIIPVAQIYRPTRSRWWDIVARKGYDTHSDRMDFGGATGGSLLLTGEQSWRLLWLELNADPKTGQTPEWMTMFRNSTAPPPDPDP
jgi:hypothetical protein